MCCAPELGEFGVAELRDVRSGDRHITGGCLVQAREDVHQGGLAGAGWAHDGGELGRRNIEGDAAESVYSGLALAVATGETFRGDDGRGRRGRLDDDRWCRDCDGFHD